MYTVIFKSDVEQIDITATTIDAFRSVGTAKIEKLAVLDGPESYRTIRIMKSPETSWKDNPGSGIELRFIPPILWKNVEEFVDHSIREHSKRLQSMNLLPLTRNIKYKILGKDRSLRETSLIELNALLSDIGVMRATHN